MDLDDLFSGVPDVFDMARKLDSHDERIHALDALASSSDTRMGVLHKALADLAVLVHKSRPPVYSGKGKQAYYCARGDVESESEADTPPRKRRPAGDTPHRNKFRGKAPPREDDERAAPLTIPAEHRYERWTGIKYPRSACPRDADQEEPLYATRSALKPQSIASRGDYDPIAVRVNAKLWSWVESGAGLVPSDIRVAALKNLTFPVVPLNKLHLSADMARIREYFPGVEEVFFEDRGGGCKFRDNVFLEAFYPSATKLKVCIFPNMVADDPRFSRLAIKSLCIVNAVFDYAACSEKGRIALRPQVYYARQLQKRLLRSGVQDPSPVLDDFESSCDEDEEAGGEPLPKRRRPGPRVRFEEE